jgi:AraC-like DNA-binding protein
MLWTSVFIVSIAQGFFLISLIILRWAANRIASAFMSAMLVIMMLTNFGYLVIRTDLNNYIPKFFAVPFGMILLYGPLIYLYSGSILNSEFRWKRKYWLHFIPYLLQLALNFPIFLAGQKSWFWFNETFLAGELPINFQEKITFALQDIHLFVYLLITWRRIQSATKDLGNTRFVLSVAMRIIWIRQLSFCFLLILVTVSFLYILILTEGHYIPVTNYAYTTVMSAVIYFIAYKMVLNPGLISPDFAKKYKSYMPFAGADGEKYINRLESLMERNKIFTNPELKLAELSKEVGLPAHQVSKLINEKMGKSFSDYINELRVAEFIRRMNDRQYASYSIFGIAMDVGFNSKSSFNTAFKKITGKSPSAYKSDEQTGTVL